MLEASLSAPFESVASNAQPGLVGTITVEVYDPTDGAIIVPATTTGITEVRPGTYVTNLTVDTVGTYMVRWVYPGSTAEEELSIKRTSEVDIRPGLHPRTGFWGEDVTFTGDTAELRAWVYNIENAPVPKDIPTDPNDLGVLSVEFLIQKPDATIVILPGVVQADGTGYLAFTDTDQEGAYTTIATFTMDGGIKRSTRSDFRVVDPFAPDLYTGDQAVSMLVWDKIEDLFDSADGGPWMRDMTMNVFNPYKIPEFFAEALFEINVYRPKTDFTVDSFIPEQDVPNHIRQNQNTPIFVLGVFLGVVRHLMRTYTEQPLPTGGQITYEDRRDYLQRWGTIYQIEWQRFDSLLKLWKSNFLGLNQGKLLVSSKAGRLLPAPLRTRNIGRGYY